MMSTWLHTLVQDTLDNSIPMFGCCTSDSNKKSDVDQSRKTKDTKQKGNNKKGGEKYKAIISGKNIKVLAMITPTFFVFGTPQSVYACDTELRKT